MAGWMDRSVREWLAGSAGTPSSTPGGGPAAAYTGALGASLVLRACERTLARGGREAAASDLEAAREDLQALVGRLGGQVDRAAQILEALASASDAPGSAGGTEALARAHREAAEAFLDTFDLSFAVLETAHRAVGAARPEDVGEMGIGSDLAAASLEALAICVRVSLPLVGDERFARPAKARLVGTLHEARRLRDRILQAVEGRLVL